MPSAGDRRRSSEDLAAEKIRQKEWAAAYLSLKDSISEELESPQELLIVLQQAGRSPSMKQIESIWSQAGADGLTFEDFCRILERNPERDETDLLKAFRKVDASHDGYLSFEELKQMLQKV